MNRDLLRRASRLLDEGSPYAVATIVRCERPTSGKPGNTAIVTPDGAMHGWIGGSCTQSEVVRHALETLEAGKSRLLACGEPGDRPDDLVHVPMSCSSGGNVEIHINPVLPPPVLLVAGASPVGHALLRLGAVAGYATVAAAPTDAAMTEVSGSTVENLAGAARGFADRPPGARLFAVVATMGESDEQALSHLVGARPDYLGVVASHKRMKAVRSVLSAQGVPGGVLDAVRGPAGLDIGASTPEEIAVSILAEIVEHGARPAQVPAGDADAPAAVDTEEESADSPAEPPEAAGWATDPVRGMTVPATGSPASAFQGEAVHSCCEERRSSDAPASTREGSTAPPAPRA